MVAVFVGLLNGLKKTVFIFFNFHLAISFNYEHNPKTIVQSEVSVTSSSTEMTNIFSLY